ncbi:MAG: hypothetical protein QM530_09315 [Phycisphaerales bacterium]|nr:hypothetical protein [Phycisphaerales bacterium]
MSHNTHEHEHHSASDNPSVAFKSAFYFVLILAGLFVAAIGFVKSMSHDEGGHADGTEQHATHEGHGEATHEDHNATQHKEHEEAPAHAEEAKHEAAPAPAEHH